MNGCMASSREAKAEPGRHWLVAIALSLSNGCGSCLDAKVESAAPAPEDAPMAIYKRPSPDGTPVRLLSLGEHRGLAEVARSTKARSADGGI